MVTYVRVPRWMVTLNVLSSNYEFKFWDCRKNIIELDNFPQIPKINCRNKRKEQPNWPEKLRAFRIDCSGWAMELIMMFSTIGFYCVDGRWKYLSPMAGWCYQVASGVVEFISHDFPYMGMWEEMLNRVNGSDKLCAVIMSAIKMEFIILFWRRNAFGWTSLRSYVQLLWIYRYIREWKTKKKSEAHKMDRILRTSYLLHSGTTNNVYRRINCVRHESDQM